MSHGGDKAPGAATVAPPPALSANKKHDRSSGSYAKSYGRESYEKHKAKQVRSLQPPQEPLRQVNANAAAVPLSTEPSLRPFAPHEPVGLELSLPSSTDFDDGEVEVSPLTTPSQSYVPKHRRRQGGDHVRPLQQDVAAAKVLRHTPPLPHQLQQHADPTALPEHRRVALSKGSEELLQHHATGKENMSIGSHAAPSPAGATAASATSLQSVPKPASSAEVKQRTVSSAFHPATSAAAATPATDFRRTASGHVHQRPLSLSGAATAPRQSPVPSTLTTSAGRRGGATAAKVPQKRIASVKSRPLTTAARKQSPSLSNAEAETAERHESPAPTPTAAERERSPEMDAGLRYQLYQMESVLDYVAEVATALGERRRCAAPPQSTKGFRASVVPTRRCGGTSSSPEALDGSDVDLPDHSVRVCSSGGTVAFLPDIHQAASRLLSAFTKLEYVQLSEDVDMPLLERDAVEYSARLLRLVDGVERQLSLHEDTLVRRRLSERRDIFRAMHQLVHFIVRMTHEVVLLRDLALRHDLGQVLEAWGSFRAGVEAQAQAAADASDIDTRDKSEDAAASSAPPLLRKHLIFPIAMMRGSPFFVWLEGRWLPAMQQWRKLVFDALQAASSGDTEGAIRRSRQEALRIDGLEEILRPGETITTLLREQVEQPIEELGRAFSMKRAAMAALREVLEGAEATDGTLNTAHLSKALTAAQAFIVVRGGRGSGVDELAASVGGDKEDAELVCRAEELLARLAEADVLHRATKAALQHPAPELVTALEHITRANELLLLWRRARDVTSAQTALAAGRAALDAYMQRLHSGRLSDNTSSLSSTNGEVSTGKCMTPSRVNGSSTAAPVPWIGDGFPASFDVRSLYVAHTPGGPWSKDLSMAYMELCEVFGTLYTQRQARRDLELALARPSVDDYGARPAVALSLSPQVTPRRPTRDALSPADTLQVSDDGANAHCRSLPCSTGGTGETHASDGSTPPAHNVPNGPSAEELHRCIQQAEEAGVGGPLVEEARARLRLLDTLRLKIHFDAQTRVLPVADAAQASFHDVYKQIHDFCQTQLQQPQRAAGAERRLRIRYEDTEGDFISLLDQQDWHMMLSELAPRGCGGVKIELFCDYPTVPGMMNNSMAVPNGDDVPRTGVESELASGDFQTETAPEASTPAGPAAVVGSAAATPEKRTNVFQRLASASKSSAVAPAASAQRKPRMHPHSLGATSPHRALLPPRTRGIGSGAVRTVSPQKGGAASRAAVGGGSARGKDSSSSAATGAAAPKTAALTAANLRRNLLYRQAPPCPEGAEAAVQEEVRRSGGRSSSDGVTTVARPAAAEADGYKAASTVAPASAAAAHNSVRNGNANGYGERESSAANLSLDMARRWEMPSDDELQLLEIQTRASMSTVCPSRCIEMPESMTTTSRPTGVPSRAGPPRNTFTATYCSRKVERISERGSGGADEAVSDIGEVSTAPKRRLSHSPSRPPRRWASDAFSLDDVETVCSERSRVPQQASMPKGPTSLPPRPVHAGGGGGTRTPQRVRRGARSTPTRSTPDAGDDDRDGGQGDGPNASDVLFEEMQRMREANTRAMAQRKSSWH
ncbi:conserved hypothetical protein [Leishmania infantum JPCM5]|uniref:PB1_domain_containing_protein_-_putative n=2 Tax=Leishmania infantum TaxID=5671 RepID=A0A6L0XD18_LEIIN|nr:conserved hypothetical protein [Leishmania infantum JPCM5]CAC9486468.1 PB1_domain_containing_protein_-_putative [Leishmania infantum]CAM67845.1 conserved hypothetical protein [Leishmania infantum JPCM5]SUZ41619.1 PB1_domain_containing_protein_-_putative [Leishmania infantum]|eukprot:XP_001465424.1 conserved hypothetical protein [Leishmania infantum JPCM5]